MIRGHFQTLCICLCFSASAVVSKQLCQFHSLCVYSVCSADCLPYSSKHDICRWTSPGLHIRSKEDRTANSLQEQKTGCYSIKMLFPCFILQNVHLTACSSVGFATQMFYYGMYTIALYL